MFKSIKTGVLAAILISTAILANAQKKIAEGTVIYDVNYVTETPGAPKEMKLKFNGDISKLEMEYGPATVTIFTDIKTETGLVAVSVPVAQMQKAAKLTKSNMEEMNAMQPKLSDFKATGEKQKIGDYNAEKYTYKDDKGGTGEAWVTTELDIPVNSVTKDFKSVKGTVIKIISKEATISLKSATEDKIGALSVTAIPSGYDEITYAELKAMQQQGGGE